MRLLSDGCLLQAPESPTLMCHSDTNFPKMPSRLDLLIIKE